MQAMQKRGTKIKRDPSTAILTSYEASAADRAAILQLHAFASVLQAASRRAQARLDGWP